MIRNRLAFLSMDVFTKKHHILRYGTNISIGVIHQMQKQLYTNRINDMIDKHFFKLRVKGFTMVVKSSANALEMATLFA